jgi:ribosomal protein S18 acetylase RimI-like enzyme
VIIRAAIPQDADTLARLARSLGIAAEAATFAQEIAAWANGFLVAEIDRDVAGYLIARVHDCPACVQAQSPIQLWRLYVAADQQGQGVAGELVAHAMARARARQHDVMWLGTAPDNVRAIAFYRKCGFREVGTAQLHHVHDSHEDVIMSRRLE